MAGDCNVHCNFHLQNQLFQLLLLVQPCNAAKMLLVTLFDEFCMQGWRHGGWQQWWQQHFGKHVLGSCVVRQMAAAMNIHMCSQVHGKPACMC